MWIQGCFEHDGVNSVCMIKLLIQENLMINTLTDKSTPVELGFQALSESTSLHILELLREQQRCVCDL